MCRWMAWLGPPVLIEELLFKSQRGLWIRVCTRAWERSRRTATGLGSAGPGPARGRRCTQRRPRGATRNLRERAAHVESPPFMAHVRAAIGSPVQETDCHPFRRGDWLFVHNGFVANFPSPPAAPHAGCRSGAALGATVGLIERTVRERGIAGAVQASFGVSDSTHMRWSRRYSSAALRHATVPTDSDVAPAPRGCSTLLALASGFRTSSHASSSRASTGTPPASAKSAVSRTFRAGALPAG